MCVCWGWGVWKEEKTAVKDKMKKEGEMGKCPGTPAGLSKPNTQCATSLDINWACVSCDSGSSPAGSSESDYVKCSGS